MSYWVGSPDAVPTVLTPALKTVRSRPSRGRDDLRRLMGMEEEDQARPDRRAGTERSNWANGGPLSRSPPGLPEPAEGSAPWRFLLFGPAAVRCDAQLARRFRLVSAETGPSSRSSLLRFLTIPLVFLTDAAARLPSTPFCSAHRARPSLRRHWSPALGEAPPRQ